MSNPASKKPQRRFQFIDNNNVSSMGANSTQVRRHVMQEYMREKRWAARAQVPDAAESEPQNRRRPVKVRWQTQTSQKRSHSKPLPIVASPNSDGSTSSRAPSSAKDDQRSQSREPAQGFVRYDGEPPLTSTKVKRPFRLSPAAFAKLADMITKPPDSPPSSISSGDFWPSTGRALPSNTYTTQNPEPQSFLSAARTDPFDCLPMKLSTQDQELFDFYANVMPACSYGFERRSPHAHNWYLSVFIPEAMKGAVCFQNTILVHAANTQAWVKGLAETRLAIEHRAKASQLLLHHYQQHPHDTSDATISATISAAALEDFDPRIERRKYAWMHWQAAVQKIRDRGGPSALVQHNRLQMLINWSDYIFSGYNGHGPTFYFDHQSSPHHSSDQEAEAIARAEIAQQCSEFITFLKCAEHLALVQAGMQSNPIWRKQQPMRYSVFLPGQPLYNLLASPNGARYTETGQFKQIVSRLAALMTINTAIWEYRHSTELSEEFFVELIENILHNDLDQHISVEALIQILLSGSNNPVLLHSERPWFVGRMLKVSKRLSRPTFEKLNELLLRFLTLGPELEPVMMGWENELRTEILQAPLVSYQSRFMLG
ncbi:uncharacterized protein Z518_07966 [Rhinocladiella mackenziei CBS 650.93]|uniref:Rhinocladiella mackenziei CBS 650.93 unplaced genomic scaffold supercont1.6, whole genome shotgun sequence n=1 Tax=Rhinocladiella mackenziei CBS 650.93 TaxID=1442369 RepID=A0A0D2FJC7_9EURO|nr:uncharacterized protein Z518_07966 [Rhinocladiella mackenziei CBS 650.93]KIX02027.1 hypothetical protein Z518_07966 [Rhinocladiella mackenziei CBS 650.93]